MSSILRLKPGREKSLLRHHPWIFSGAVSRVEGAPEFGETVQVQDVHGNFLAWAAYSPQSQIRGRVWSWNPDDVIDREFFRQRLAQSILARTMSTSYSTLPSSPAWHPSIDTNALRLVHAESDGLPGLILDRYGDTLVMQVLAAGAEAWRETLADLSLELTGAVRIYERSDVEARKQEGLTLRTGVLRGDQPPLRQLIHEGDRQFFVDVYQGHKTGFYLDQRLNRFRVNQLAANRDTLDCFTYSGGFAIQALLGGAKSVVAIDASADALALARENLALNKLAMDKVEWIEGDVFHVLRSFRDARRSFDMIILDPPKFAQTSAQVERAARGYKDINLLAFKLLRSGGLLVTFSCSGGVSQELFQKIVAGAALDAGVQAMILEYLHQAPDHPVALNFPEGSYLKGFVIRVA